MELDKLVAGRTKDDYGGTIHGGADVQDEDRYFECTREQLQTLVKVKGEAAQKELEATFGSIDELCEALKTSASYGLDPTNLRDMELRVQKFGSNEIEMKKSKSFFHFLYEAVKDQTLIILIIAAFVSIVLAIYESIFTIKKNGENSFEDSESGLIEGIGISVAVVIIVIVTASINYNKDRQFKGLQKKLNEQVKCFVVRLGKTMEISAFDIVVGDICIVKIGDVIPADGIILKSSDLKVDESSHTGESEEVHKSYENDLILYSGTHVIEGSAHMLALCVGEYSQKGIIYSLLGVTYDSENEPEQKKSILHAKLCTISKYITYGGTLIALLTFSILVLRYCIDNFLYQKNEWGIEHFQNIINFLIIAITILVVAIPEGLPLAVIMALAFSIKKMMKDNNLVRHLDSCETMGSATIICSDKTGTLTTNKMTVGQCYIAGKLGSPDDVIPEIGSDLKYLIAKCVAINSGTTSQVTVDGYSQTGNKTECALISFVNRLGFTDKQLLKNIPEDSSLKVYSFNSQRKWMGTVVSTEIFRGKDEGRTVVAAGDPSNLTLLVKGAAEIVFAKCSHIVNESGAAEDLNGAKKSEIVQNIVDKMAENGLRTICLAYREFQNLPPTWNWDDEDEVMNKLVCLAFVGIEDPVRTEVPEAIRECQRAGIDVVMVTGDHLLTAIYIAKKCGLVENGNADDKDSPLDRKVTVDMNQESDLMITGESFNSMVLDKNGKIDQTNFDAVWPRLRVLARATPHDKYTLVSGLMDSRVSKQRQVVAVTGDGTNDGPALKKAHVGLCMGISGTEVAKEASDIILLDDNFTSIVRSVVWGRHVHDSIAKFIQFQLTVNFVSIVIVLLGACVFTDTPLRGIQMLWLNLLMDTLASLSLAAEEPSSDLLNRKPYCSEDSIISPTMLVKIIGHGCYQLLVLLVVLCAGYRWMHVEPGFSPDLYAKPNIHYTFLFNVFVMMTLFNEVNCRRIDTSLNVFGGLHKSPLFVFIWTLSFLIQILIVEFGGSLFRTHPLSVVLWAACLLIGISQLLFGLFITGLIRLVVHCKNKRRTRSQTEYAKFK